MIKSKTNKLGIKTVAIVLSFLMIVTVIPNITVFAEGKNAISNNSAIDIDTKKETEKEPEFVTELSEKRTLNEKYFLMDDGSITVAQYSQPVHFVDSEGLMKDIDNSLVEVTDTANDKKLYKNKSNSFNVSFSKEIDNGDLAFLEKDEYKIAWSLEQNNITTAKKIESEKTVNKKVDELENITSSIEYDDVFNSTDITYVTNANGVKENIVLKDENAPKQFSFQYNTCGLKYKVTDKGDIELYNERDPKTVVFYIEKPYMFDAQKYRSDDVKMEISETESGFEATIIPDEEWVSSPERVYPIVIDPTVLSRQIRNQIWDIDMMQGQSHDFDYNAEDLVVGADASGRIFRSLIKFNNLPNIGDTTRIVNAYMNITAYQGPVKSGAPALRTRPSGNPKVDIHRVDEYWPESTNWGDSGYINAWEISDYFVYNTTDTFFKADISQIVSDWYTGTASNYGIMLKSDDEETPNKAMQFTSSDWGYNTEVYMPYRPALLINYRDVKGIEDYWTYTTMDAGRYGTAAVNNFSGNLIVEQNITGVSGNKLPVAISFIYDSSNRANNYYNVGNGWKTNYDIRVCQSSLPNYPYYLVDSDGTEHYFYGEITGSQWKDEDGLGLTLKRDSNVVTNGYVITDKGKNKTYFNSDGKLVRLCDTLGNYIGVSYDSLSRLNSLTDGAGRVYSFSYNAGGNLLSITNPANRIVSFGYIDNNLTSITYPDIKTTSFVYDTNRLDKVISPDSTYTKCKYNYVEGHLYTSALEYYGTNNELNSDYNFIYNNSSTDIYSNCDYTVCYTYQFDNFGRTIQIVNCRDGNSQYYKYGAPGGNNTGTENKLLNSINSPQATTTYYTDNDTYNNRSKWYASSYSENTTIATDSTRGNNSVPSLRVTQNNGTGGYTAVVFDAGTLPGGYSYDFSAHLNTNGTVIDTDCLSVNAYFYDTQYEYDSYGSFECGINYTNENDWLLLSSTLEISGDTHCYVVIGGYLNSPGSFWVDDLQICIDSGSEHYNYVNDSAFLTGNSSWTYKRNNVISNDTSASFEYDSCTIDGCIAEKRSISQTINCQGSAGDAIAFGAKGVAYSVETTQIRPGMTEKSTYRIRLEMSGPSGTATFGDNSNILDFNYTSDEWQNVSGVIIAPIDFTTVTMFFDYDYNANFAIFNSPYIYKENFSQSYTYDSNGNIVSSKDLSETESRFSYQNNNLLQMINPTGSRFSYDYDEDNNLMLHANSSDGQLLSFSYDQYGNPISSETTAYFTMINPDINGDGNINNKDLTRLFQYLSDWAVEVNELALDVNRDGKITNKDLTRLSQHLSGWDDLEANETYYIRNILTGNSIKKSNSDAVNGTYAAQNNSIRWKLLSAGETDVYYIQPDGDTTNYLTVENASAANNANIVLSPINNSDSQKFKIVSDGNSSYSILTKVSNYTLAVDARDFNNSGSADLDKNIVQHTLDASSGYQKWRFEEYEPDNSGKKKITSTATYTTDGNYLSSCTDSYGATTSYQYNSDGTISTSTNSAGFTTSYSYYNNTSDLQSVTSGNSTNTYTYENDQIKTITTSNGTVYTFNYDVFGRRQSVDINRVNSVSNARRLVNYKYNSDAESPFMIIGSKNNLYKVEYGNNDFYDIYYDECGRVLSKSSTMYNYNLDGTLKSKIPWGGDLGATHYFRDLSGRIIKKSLNELFDGSGETLCSLDYKYINKKNLLDKLSLICCGTQYITSFVYGDVNSGEIPDTVYGLKHNNTLRLKYGFDEFARQNLRILYTGGNNIVKRFAYKTNSSNNTTGYLVDTVTENGYTYTYTYDSLGNITEYNRKDSNNSVIEHYIYQYDNKGQLTFAGTSATDGITYTYDSNGNILTKHNSSNNTTVTCGYNDSTWADLLTSYNSQPITYDTIGNPLTYNNGTAMTFTWTNGRNLQTVSKGNSAISYSYDGESTRTSKTVDGAYTQYIVVDGVLYGERRYNNNDDSFDLIIYLYDENSNKYGFTYNGTEYYYQTNLQGDVVGIYDSNGQLVVEYSYDAWGKLLSVTGTSASTIGQINPIRYRGYYYDNETGFYYLQSRYYDPETGRFLNADGQIMTGDDILGSNLFAYCGNNPINNMDIDGHLWKSIKQWISDTYNKVKNQLTKAIGKVKKNSKKSAKKIASGVTLELGIGMGLKVELEIAGIDASVGVKSDSITAKINSKKSQIGQSNEAEIRVGVGPVEIGPSLEDWNPVSDNDEYVSEFSWYKRELTLDFGAEIYLLYGFSANLSMDLNTIAEGLVIIFE